MGKLLSILQQNWPSMIRYLYEGPGLSQEEIAEMKKFKVYESDFSGIERRITGAFKTMAESQAVRALMLTGAAHERTSWAQLKGA